MEVLASGAEKTFENAEQLFHEAELLGKAGAVSRALYLHQIPLEECSKVDTLGAWAVSLLVRLEVDQKKVLAALAKHSSKNRSNAYMLAGSEAEKDAKSRGDLKGATEAFKNFQEEFHQKSNRAKNASLYVDWVDGAFTAPSERISKQMLIEITERNATFLGYAHNGVKMMKRLAESPDKMRGLLSGFADQVEKLRGDEADDSVAAMEALLARFLEDGKRELKDEKIPP
ncbi:AbiV family abortive infection protein [Mesorhizobium caraganae]|uniref:AbiV family abortive infection protein n=1 Tax=Mesorhizobium caraganae TaxID=483206 RepID=UPI003ED16AC5